MTEITTSGPITLSPEDAEIVLLALDTATEYMRNDVACCPDADGPGFCDGCRNRAELAAACEALHAKLKRA